jgi:hypothetical protein
MKIRSIHNFIECICYYKNVKDNDDDIDNLVTEQNIVFEHKYILYKILEYLGCIPKPDYE